MSEKTQNAVAPLVIEPVQRGDLRSVMRLTWKTTNKLYPAPFFQHLFDESREYFRVVREPSTGAVVGFVIAAKQPGMTQNFLLLAVEPGLIGLGVRKALIEEVQDRLRKEGVRQFAVEVQGGDAKLLDFYRKQGFHMLGIERAGAFGDEERTLVVKDLR